MLLAIVVVGAGFLAVFAALCFTLWLMRDEYHRCEVSYDPNYNPVGNSVYLEDEGEGSNLDYTTDKRNPSPLNGVE